MTHRFDAQILELIPHREPMLLINRLVSVSAKRSEALVTIDTDTPFVSEHGVPSWIGLEYMGQTAALIAGFQEREGLCEPQLGFLMGSRKYHCEVEYFALHQPLRVICEEGALVGSSLANFNCTIQHADTEQLLAVASLSVFRRPLQSQ